MSYMYNYSSEKLVLCILNDFLNKIDNNSNIQIILVDLSVDFDNVQGLGQIRIC